jgi:predicted dehydrogenase
LNGGSTPSAPLRLGLAGCGRLAEAGYLSAIAAVDEVELVAVADPRPDRRERIARLAGGNGGADAVASHADVGDLLDRGEVQALIVASPPAEHLEHARLASDAGVPCLVEKPPAPDLAGAELLAALERPPWIGFNRRFQHASALLDAVPADGPLELLLELNYRRASWRAVSIRDDAVLDLAPHLIDLALLLARAPTATVRSARLTPERVELELDTGRGPARIRGATDRAYRERVVVRRPGGGRIAASRTGGRLRGAMHRIPGRVHPLTGSLRGQLAAFAAAARGADGGLLASADDGVRTMRVIEAAA